MLVTCPECHRRISERADPCPNCGLPQAGKYSREATERSAQMLRELPNTGIVSVYGEPIECTNPRCGFRELVSLKREKIFGIEVVEVPYRVGYAVRFSTRCRKCGHEAYGFH